MLQISHKKAFLQMLMSFFILPSRYHSSYPSAHLFQMRYLLILNTLPGTHRFSMKTVSAWRGTRRGRLEAAAPLPTSHLSSSPSTPQKQDPPAATGEFQSQLDTPW